MSVSQISSRHNTAITLLQQVDQNFSAKTASADTNTIIKTVNGISTAPGAAAKQASGAAFTFAVSQSPRDDAQKAEAPGSIVMAGIGSGEAVERFASWDAVDARIRADGTMDDKQKSEWLSQTASLKEAIGEVKKFQQSDLYLSLTSGSFQTAKDAIVRSFLADNTALAEIKNFINTPPVKTFIREDGA